ncbi:MAG: septum formation initiator family protein [Clostridia bacterium]|nr:septum formation initiator family protein [Clostridia bacterium]
MNEEKKRRVFSAVLSGLIMLVTVLVAVITYQLIGIISRKNQIERLDAEIASLKEQIKTAESDIDAWNLEWKIIERARELGLYFEEEEE